MIRNFTPHTVKLLTEKATDFPSEGVARVLETTIMVEPIENFPVVKKTYGEVQGLPNPEPNTFFIVSAMVLQASNRTDLICPDTGPDSAVRDLEGTLVGVRRFQTKY